MNFTPRLYRSFKKIERGLVDMIYCYDSELLNELEFEKRYSMEEINNAIKELENKIGKCLFGKRFITDLELLYLFKERKEYQLKCLQCAALKREIENQFVQILSDVKESRVRTFSIWVKIHNKGLGKDYEIQELTKVVEEMKKEVV